MSDANTKAVYEYPTIGAVVDSNADYVPYGCTTRRPSTYVTVAGTAGFDRNVEIRDYGEVIETTTADEHGRWHVVLLKKNLKNLTGHVGLTVRSNSDDSLISEHYLFNVLWPCS